MISPRAVSAGVFHEKKRDQFVDLLETPADPASRLGEAHALGPQDVLKLPS